MHDLLDRLRTVRRRQRWQSTLRCAAWGFSFGAAFALLTTLVHVVRLGTVPLPLVVVLVAAGPAIGLAAGGLAGWLSTHSWLSAATAVDAHYGLRDRAVTALEFLSLPEIGGWHRLQIDDAVRHLRQVDARRVVPLRLPRSAALGVLLVGTASLLLVVSRPRASAPPAPPVVNPVILAEAEAVERQLVDPLRRVLETQPDERIEELVDELKRLTDEMKQPGVDPSDALARLSEMQAAISGAKAGYNLEAVDAQLENLAEAVSPAEALRPAADALRNQDYPQAAAELRQFEAGAVDPKESRAVGEKLEKLRPQLEEAQLADLNQAAKDLADGLARQDASLAGKGAEKLAESLAEHAMRKDVSRTLESQLAMLAEAKNNCRANGEGQEHNGGDGVARSSSPKTTWGRGQSNQPLGEQSSGIETTRRQESLSGTLGDGPSERESTRSAEGRQQATRALQERYREYHRGSESVLQSEDLPLGHRQTIRRYFESIRPDGGEATDALGKQLESAVQ